jgi:hypothetical protein
VRLRPHRLELEVAAVASLGTNHAQIGVEAVDLIRLLARGLPAARERRRASSNRHAVADGLGAGPRTHRLSELARVDPLTEPFTRSG